ncbi:MAG TPA: hypothetical protein VGH26_03400 [Gaiellaceae bacterium]
MDFYDWMLALHLLSAFSVAAALVLYSVLVVSGRRTSATLADARLLFRVAPVATPLIAAGTVLVLIFGIILAVDSNRFEIWNGWIIAGIVLWAILGAVGQRTGAYYTDVQKLAEREGDASEQQVLALLRAPTGAVLHLATIGVFVLILLDMLFKPGA